MNKKWLLSLSLLLLVFVVSACNGNNESEEQKSAEDSGSVSKEKEQTEMPKPDLTNIPDVVAEVNGEKISKDEFEATYKGQFQQAMMQAQLSGQQIDQDQLKGQIADAMIGQKLIIQEAKNSGFNASRKAIDETLNSLVEQNGLKSQDDFFAALEKQGMEKEEVMSQIETQVKVDKLIESESGDIEPTEKELQEAYDTYTAQLKQMGSKDGKEQEIPSFDEIKSDLAEQVKSQKESKAYQTLVDKLKADADITNYM